LPHIVPAGARLTLLGDGRRMALRTLAPLAVGPCSTVPVLASLQALKLRDALVYLPTADGLVTAEANLTDDGGPLLLRLGADVRTHQRRHHDRWEVVLEILVALPDDAHIPGRRVVTGRTVNVSAGGLLVDLEAPDVSASLDSPYPQGELDAELTLPGGHRVPTVLTVVDVDGHTIRTSFAAMTEPDRQQLAGLVFGTRGRHRADSGR
jgi:hypothetical protein